jgi:hypothetical protein
VLLHWDGAAWSSVASGTGSTLITVHGSTPPVAVGGGGVAAVIVERGAGGAWVPAGVAAGTPSLNGVFVPPSGAAVAAGFMRTVLRRAGSSWSLLAGVPSTARDLHAVFVDDEDNAVMVGGDLFGLSAGVLVSYGRRSLPSEIVPQARLRGHVEPLLSARCAEAGCHLPPFLAEELDLSSASAIRARTVGVPSRQSRLVRVAPGRPSASYLWHKVQGTQATVGGGGNRMPNGQEPLPADALAAIRAWILEGAPDG